MIGIMTVIALLVVISSLMSSWCVCVDKTLRAARKWNGFSGILLSYPDHVILAAYSSRFSNWSPVRDRRREAGWSVLMRPRIPSQLQPATLSKVIIWKGSKNFAKQSLSAH